MPPATVTRRLAAIVIADVVGYSRLMERDDTGTFSRLRSIRDEVVDPAIVSHDGRIVKTAGDGFLAEFPSALAALRASVQIQREMAKRNEGIATEDRIDYRIGVNLGDVMAEKDDIAGDGVNVASRLESLAEPGGICVSGSVREQVHGQMAVTFEDVGEQQVKNIARPIRIFRVVVAASAASSTPALSMKWLRVGRGGHAITVGAGAVLLMGAAIWWALPRWHISVAGSDGPPALSVAVLPLAGDSESAKLAQALTGELPGPLARSDIAIHVVPVAQRPTAANDFRRVASELNVRYVLDGSVQSRGGEGETRLTLVDGASGAQVWSETIVLPLNGSAADRKHTVRTAMEHLRNRLINLETRRAAASPEGSGSCVEEVLRAGAVSQGDMTLDTLRRQETIIERALSKDSDCVPALLALSENLDGQLDIDSHVDRDRLMRRMDDITTRAVNLNPAWPDTWAQRAGALMSLGRWEASLEAIDKGIATDPEAAWLVKTKAHLTALAGRPRDTLALVAKATAMDPEEGGRGMRIACEARLLLGEYTESVADCERALGRGFDEFQVAYFLAPAYAHIGDDRAKVETAKILRRAPGFTIEMLKAKKYSVQPDYLKMAEDHWYSGLRKAGIPEK